MMIEVLFFPSMPGMKNDFQRLNTTDTQELNFEILHNDCVTHTN